MVRSIFSYLKMKLEQVKDSRWNSLTATVDWCEPNYVVSYYIAEFWNTFSSVSMSVVGIYMLYLYKNQPLTRCIKTCHWMLVLMGIGSVYFHSTLSYAGQLVDELTMFWYLLLALMHVFRNVRGRKTQVLKRVVLGSVGLYYTVLMISLNSLPTVQFVLFQGTFISLAFYLWHNVYDTARSDTKALQQMRRGTVLICLAWSSWMADYFLCDAVQNYHLHAFWHIIATGALYYLSQVQVYTHFTNDCRRDQVYVTGSGHFQMFLNDVSFKSYRWSIFDPTTKKFA